MDEPSKNQAWELLAVGLDCLSTDTGFSPRAAI
jgi:hypothetical protein